jgi:hypothetical protein
MEASEPLHVLAHDTLGGLVETTEPWLSLPPGELGKH